MNIALIHDYLTQRGGAERVFELFCHHLPEADVLTSLYDPARTIDLGDRPVQTTYLQHLPGATRYFRLLAPLYYGAFQSLDLTAYDLLLTSTTSFAKAVRRRPDAKHICFCHNITRFLWDTTTYLREFPRYRRIRPLLEPIFALMRQQDYAIAQGPDLYVANSTTVKQRIESVYHKPAVVLHYPIDETKFTYGEQKQEFYLVAARLLGYKRVDCVIEAFNALGLPLKIMGDGPERRRLESLVRSPQIEFLGEVSDTARTQWMANAKAVIVAAVEDYGLVPIEANVSGTPVLSYGCGGVLDTQREGETGLFFRQQTPAAIIEAVRAFEGRSWHPAAIRQHALENFSRPVFFQKLDRLIAEVCTTRTAPLTSEFIT
ncbi:MAG: glycosyltransferase family 4 protein [Oscillatoriales cyanobacterium SM2_2_1]|nr:glycosyltransferase family 4 protein [Oscillatoriales cyanobacterium SM2_2_1]